MRRRTGKLQSKPGTQTPTVTQLHFPNTQLSWVVCAPFMPSLMGSLNLCPPALKAVYLFQISMLYFLLIMAPNISSLSLCLFAGSAFRSCWQDHPRCNQDFVRLFKPTLVSTHSNLFFTLAFKPAIHQSKSELPEVAGLQFQLPSFLQVMSSDTKTFTT